MSSLEDHRCGTCRHHRGGTGDPKHCPDCDQRLSEWEPERVPLSAADLLACDDLSLLDRGELERLVWILRAEIKKAEAR